MGILQDKYLWLKWPSNHNIFHTAKVKLSGRLCLLSYFEGELIFHPGSQKFEQIRIIMRPECKLGIGRVIPVNSPLAQDVLT